MAGVACQYCAFTAAIFGSMKYFQFRWNKKKRWTLAPLNKSERLDKAAHYENYAAQKCAFFSSSLSLSAPIVAHKIIEFRDIDLKFIETITFFALSTRDQASSCQPLVKTTASGDHVIPSNAKSKHVAVVKERKFLACRRQNLVPIALHLLSCAHFQEATEDCSYDSFWCQHLGRASA